ncbi:hypothetical protein MIND_00808000 [Mycena indigotica]|uniref:Uncharacterized protein n=1 Tax=Mycena indigotica TaxID=2126181 RepID=A0A8H6SFT6_9AGAR|nr:uncharacterized protein MIND_00808000 [Mycena indigotica]KAF7298609.1 hypothetical protein MIND_00808000 [Mycena indigotica]
MPQPKELVRYTSSTVQETEKTAIFANTSDEKFRIFGEESMARVWKAPLDVVGWLDPRQFSCTPAFRHPTTLPSPPSIDPSHVGMPEVAYVTQVLRETLDGCVDACNEDEKAIGTASGLSKDISVYRLLGFY